MENRRKLLVSVCLFASTLLYGQVVGIKTNVLMDITKTINLGAEIGLSKKTTLDLYLNYNPWEKNNYKMFKMFAFQPEYRYWFCDRFNGHFVGIHAHGGIYQAAGIKMPFGLWKELEDHRFKGNFLVQVFPTVINGFWKTLERGTEYRCGLRPGQIRKISLRGLRRQNRRGT